MRTLCATLSAFLVIFLVGCSPAMRQWYAEGMPLPPVFGSSGSASDIWGSSDTEPAPAPETVPVPKPRKLDVATRLRSADKAVVLEALSEVCGDETLSTDVASEFNRLLTVQGWSRVKLEILDCLSYLDDGRPHVDALDAALHDPDPDVREEACSVLEDMERKPAVDVLIKNLSNPYADTRTCCMDALEWLTDQEFRTQAEWQAWWQRHRAGFQF